jgi:hypothetical protein
MRFYRQNLLNSSIARFETPFLFPSLLPSLLLEENEELKEKEKELFEKYEALQLKINYLPSVFLQYFEEKLSQQLTPEIVMATGGRIGGGGSGKAGNSRNNNNTNIVDCCPGAHYSILSEMQRMNWPLLKKYLSFYHKENQFYQEFLKKTELSSLSTGVPSNEECTIKWNEEFIVKLFSLLHNTTTVKPTTEESQKRIQNILKVIFFGYQIGLVSSSTLLQELSSPQLSSLLHSTIFHSDYSLYSSYYNKSLQLTLLEPKNITTSLTLNPSSVAYQLFSTMNCFEWDIPYLQALNNREDYAILRDFYEKVFLLQEHLSSLSTKTSSLEEDKGIRMFLSPKQFYELIEESQLANDENRKELFNRFYYLQKEYEQRSSFCFSAFLGSSSSAEEGKSTEINKESEKTFEEYCLLYWLRMISFVLVEGNRNRPPSSSRGGEREEEMMKIFYYFLMEFYFFSCFNQEVSHSNHSGFRYSLLSLQWIMKRFQSMVGKISFYLDFQKLNENEEVEYMEEENHCEYNHRGPKEPTKKNQQKKKKKNNSSLKVIQEILNQF